MGEDEKEGGGRTEADRSKERRSVDSVDVYGSEEQVEPPAQGTGLSDTEKIGRSLDEVSDIIHDVLYESKDSDAVAGGGEAASGAAAGVGAGMKAGQRAGYEKGGPERPAAGETVAEAGTERPPDKAEAGPEARPDEAAPDRAVEKIGESEPEADHRQGKSSDAGAAAEKAEVSGKPDAEAGGEDRIPNPVIESILGPSEVDEHSGGSGSGQGGRTYSYDDFIDERVLISRDAFGRKEMKIKVLEVSDEKAPTSWKLGDRVKVDKILVTVKHLETQQVEECEFDIESIEKEIARDRHYSSTNRWVPTTDIKNGYVAGSRHTSLISDAVALEYIIF